jgi:hypothetical protein
MGYGENFLAQKPKRARFQPSGSPHGETLASKSNSSSFENLINLQVHLTSSLNHTNVENIIHSLHRHTKQEQLRPLKINVDKLQPSSVKHSTRQISPEVQKKKRKGNFGWFSNWPAPDI